MTIKKMRSIMKEKVVPEEIVPQNIINCLIDEEAEPPKLDAFAFLMRLRALGIGSADFLILLEGCGAPEDVVERIRDNPAMNLQGLILTLESSELDSDDYTRMLLTARQVWERTLTLRLEKTEKLSHELEGELESKPAEDETDEYPEEEETPELSETEEEQPEDEEYEDGDPYYDEDMTEMSFTAVFNKINAEIREGVLTGSSDEDTDETDGETRTSESAEVSEEYEDGETVGTSLRGEDEEYGDEDDEDDEDVGETDDEDVGEDEYEDDGDDEDEYEDEDDEDDDEDGGETDGRSRYHTGAIIGSAAGAAVLVAAGLFIGNSLGKNGAETLHYAKSASDIFDKVYDCYEVSAGGETAHEIRGESCAVFGDLLIGSGDSSRAPMLFSEGNAGYSLTEEAISVSIVENGRAVSLEDIVPPENSQFVAAFDENGELYAIFGGKQSGYMKITDGKAEYTVRQDGVLTDWDISDGKVRLGTVYTPVFDHTFDISDENAYLPRTGLEGEVSPISPQNVIISGTNGYSYGISAEYSAENGEMSDVLAIMGDPAAASADGRFVLNGDEGLIVKAVGRRFETQKTGRLMFAAFGKSVCAVIEEPTDGEAEVINLYDDDLTLTAALTGAPADIGGLWFGGDVLTVSGASDIYVRVDCSDPAEPKPLTLKMVYGVISGSSAITFETSGGKLTIARCELENGTLSKTAQFDKELSAESAETVRPGAAQAMVFGGAKNGAAYRYFDGVSVVSEYAVFGGAGQPGTVSVFDDKTGFTAAFDNNGTINAVCAEGVKVIK